MSVAKQTSSPRRWMASGNELISIDGGYDEGNGGDSIFGDSSRMSLVSDMKNYRLENNRKYHTYRDGAYWIPHDDEALRLDAIAHHIFLLSLHDKLFLAPIEDPQRVIDIGTGIGIWASDFADKYPNAEVLGTDLSPCQRAPPSPNLRFETDDCCSEWVYPPNHFDYVHVRLLYACVADWPAFYRECYDHIAPGGYIEQAELTPIIECDDNSIGEDSMYRQCSVLAVEAFKKFGKSILIAPFLKQMITDAGFEDVVEVKYKWPIGEWPVDQRLKDVGRWHAQHWLEGMDAWSMRVLTQYMGYTYEQVKEYTTKVKDTVRDRKQHAYQAMTVVYARKPL